ncbi:PLDc N-terminal domain-containing protein, partial [uncultured Leuconostoc sp.]
MLGDSLWIILLILLVANTFGAVITVFSQQRDIASIWAWLLVLIMLPVLGFIIFFFVGSRISDKRIFRLRTQEQLGLEQIADNQRRQLEAIEQLLPIPNS